MDIGRLGRFEFDKGWYIYTGSALGSLDKRLERHFRGSSSGRLHWHLDYLAPLGVDKAFRVLPPGGIGECGLNRAVGDIPGAVTPVKGFGSSDCNCPSHLHRLARRAWPEIDGLTLWKPTN